MVCLKGFILKRIFLTISFVGICSCAAQGNAYMDNCKAEIGKIRSTQVIGSKLLKNHNFKSALEKFEIGITYIGDTYLSSEIDDDTAVKYEIAKYQISIGHLDVSANLLESVLKSRILLVENKCK